MKTYGDLGGCTASTDNILLDLQNSYPGPTILKGGGGGVWVIWFV